MSALVVRGSNGSSVLEFVEHDFDLMAVSFLPPCGEPLRVYRRSSIDLMARYHPRTRRKLGGIRQCGSSGQSNCRVSCVYCGPSARCASGKCASGATVAQPSIGIDHYA